MFAVQDEIAQAIATVLQGKLAARPASVRRHTPLVPGGPADLRSLQKFEKIE